MEYIFLFLMHTNNALFYQMKCALKEQNHEEMLMSNVPKGVSSKYFVKNRL